MPRHWNPWAPLTLQEPDGPFTRWKLDRLESAPAACLQWLAGAPGLASTPVPDRTTGNAGTAGQCGWQAASRIGQIGQARFSSPFMLTCGAAVALARWDLEPDALVAIVVDLPSGVAYAELTAVASDIVAYHDSTSRTQPLVLVMTQDYAQVLGQTIQAIRPGLPLLVIDQVGLGEGDFVDIGLPMLDGRAVPLSIKTLVFYD